MSNKPKNFKSHNNNNLNKVEIHNNNFIQHAIKWPRKRFGFGKHVGSKSFKTLLQRVTR